MVNVITNINISGNNQQIGGDNFDGQWIFSSLSIASSVAIGGESNLTYSLENYLPNNTHDYEVLIQVSGGTKATSNCMFEYYIFPGSTNSGMRYRICRAQTRTNSQQFACGTGILSISKNNQNITLRNGATDEAYASITLRGYRRIGKNGLESNYITNINQNNITYPIYTGGITTDYVWLRYSSSLFESTLTANQIVEIDLSSILPDDNSKYLVTFTVLGYTGSTSGNHIILRLGNNNSATSNPMVCRQDTHTSSQMRCGGNIILPLTAKKVYISNSGNATSGTVYVYIRNYRKIGTNA